MTVLTHAQIWNAIDALAASRDLSASGLAKKAGLDPTSFNPSKRFTVEGRQRWPSTESIAKVLRCTETSLDTFMALIEQPDQDTGDVDYRKETKPVEIPLIGFAKAGVGGFFDDSGFPAGHGWEMIAAPGPVKGGSSYALKISGDSMLPLYREGDILIVDPEAELRKGDRVVAKTCDGEVLAKVLERHNARSVVFSSLNPDHPDLSFSPEEIDWIARIVWASQ